MSLYSKDAVIDGRDPDGGVFSIAVDDTDGTTAVSFEPGRTYRFSGKDWDAIVAAINEVESYRGKVLAP